MTAMPEKPPIPDDAYLWWSIGAADNQKINDEDFSTAAKGIRDALQELSHQRPAAKPEDLIHTLALIYIPEKLRRRYR